MLSRRRFVRDSLVAAGMATIGANSLVPHAAQASRRPRRSSSSRSGMASPEVASVPSLVPCNYSLGKLLQDATTNGSFMGNLVQAPQGSKYTITMDWQLLSGPVDGWISFRVKDLNNYYAVVFYPTQVGFVAVNGGVWTDVARAFRPIDTTHPATFTLAMDAYTFTLADDAVPGSPIILTWTDPWQISVLGGWVNHLVGNGTKGYWQSVVGTALSTS